MEITNKNYCRVLSNFKVQMKKASLSSRRIMFSRLNDFLNNIIASGEFAGEDPRDNSAPLRRNRTVKP